MRRIGPVKFTTGHKYNARGQKQYLYANFANVIMSLASTFQLHIYCYEHTGT